MGGRLAIPVFRVYSDRIPRRDRTGPRTEALMFSLSNKAEAGKDPRGGLPAKAGIPEGESPRASEMRPTLAEKMDMAVAPAAAAAPAGDMTPAPAAKAIHTAASGDRVPGQA